MREGFVFTLPDDERENWVLSIFGQKGSGKTFLAKEIAEQEDRVIVIDALGQFDNMDPIMGRENCIRALQKAEKQKRFSLSFWNSETEVTLELLELIFLMQKITLIVDETSLWVSSSFLPTEFNDLIMYGRHQAINQVYMSRRPAEINRALTSQSDVIVAFKQHEKRDIDYLKSFMGDMADSARVLPKYKIVAYGPDEKMPIPVLERKYSSPNTIQPGEIVETP